MPAPLAEFDAFCRREYPRLVGALGLYTGDRAVAEEIAQEALARAWRRWRTVSQAEDPPAWLFVVAFNLGKSHLRRLAAEARAKLRLRSARPAAAPAPEDTYDLLRALRAVPHRYRTVLVLRYYVGMTLPEIARHLDVPLATTKTWCARGLARLRATDAHVIKETPDGNTA